MDNILQGIPRIQCYIDGLDDEDHLRTLERVLSRLQQNGVTVKKDKCYFLQDAVEYLGHVVNKEGLHAS